MEKAVQYGYKVVAKAASQLGASPNATCITVQEGDILKIDFDKLRKILIRPEIGDAPIAIITIAGATRAGKSFLMNYFAKRLSNMQDDDWMSDEINAGWPGKIFPWRAGNQRGTTGINIGNQIYKVTGKSGEEVVVLLVDTQGLFDNTTPNDVNKTLLTLSTIMSSVQIFNTKEQVNTQDLGFLKTCVDFAIATAEDDKTPYFELQELLFLVRDGKEEDDESQDEDFGFKPGQKYIDGIIKSKDGGSEQIETRKRIKDSFNTVRCFIMPHPGLGATKKKFRGKTLELDNDFQKLVKEFVEDVVDSKTLVPKRKKGEHGNYMTGRELLNLIGVCGSLFSSKLFAVKDMMQANVKSYYASKCEEALLRFDDKTRDIFFSPGITTEDEITKHYEVRKANAVGRFNLCVCVGNGDEKNFYRGHLEKKCNEHFESAKERLKAKKNEIKMKRALKTAEVFEKYESKMRKRRSKETSMEDSALENMHEYCLKKLKERNEGKINVEDLTRKAQLHLKKLVKENRERRNFENQLVDEKRQKKLFALSVRLQEKNSTMWSEKLSKKCLDDDEMTTQEQKMKEDIQAEYYREALEPHELELVWELNKKMEKEYEQAVASLQRKRYDHRQALPSKAKDENLKFSCAGDESTASHAKDVKQYLHKNKKEEISIDADDESAALHLGDLTMNQAKNEKKKLSRVIEKLIASYARDLKRDVNANTTENRMESQKLEKQREKREEFYEACSKHLGKYHLRLCRVMEKNYEEAKKRNEENKEMHRERATVLVGDMVRETEENLNQIMSDRYIAKKALYKTYDDLQMKLTERATANLVLNYISLPLKEYMEIVSTKIRSSLKKMEVKNEESKEAHIITAAEVEELPGVWQRLWQLIKDFFSRS